MNKIDPTLRAHALQSLEQAREALKRDKNLTPHVRLTQAADGFGETFISIDGEIMNDDAAKKELARHIRSKVDEHGYLAAVFLSDTYTTSDLDVETAARARLVQRILRCDQVTSWRMLGLPVFEAITVMIETFDVAAVVRQVYHRDGDGNVTGFGEIEEMEGNISGRMWFLSDRP
jgi:hypothetical protein